MWWHTLTQGMGSEGETDEWSGSPVLFTLPRNTGYPALLPLIRTPRLPVFDWTDAPADLNGLIRFAERQNLVSAHVSSHSKRSLPLTVPNVSSCDNAATLKDEVHYCDDLYRRLTTELYKTLVSLTLGLYDRTSWQIAFEWNQQMHYNFPIIY